MTRWLLTLATVLTSACSGDKADGGQDDTATVASDGGAVADGCPEAGELSGYTELGWDDGSPIGSIDGRGWSVVDVALDETVLNQAVRFDLDRPATIHGFAVQLEGVPTDPGEMVSIGLYPDFGHNGFDFWPDQPYEVVERCGDELEEGEWATFSLAEPVALDQPGLVYVVHQRPGDGPAVMFDGTTTNTDGSCSDWDDCHSSMNLPELTDFVSGGYSYSFYNGYSFQLQYDFMVRLYVEYTDDLADEDRVFQAVDDIALSSRSAWGDYDNDGWEDLYTVGRLYRNLGDGGFEDATDASGITALGLSSSGGVWGDFDNDGCLDLLSFAESYTAKEALLHNECDGTFSDWTDAAGITDVQDYNDCDGGETYDSSPTPAAAWMDIDGDGWVDLYMANFICWTNYSYYTDTVWHNDGWDGKTGSFSEWTGDQGFSSTKKAGRGANPIDHDQDGDVDLLVNNYVLHANLFYDNLGNGTVDEDGTGVGLAGHRDLSGTTGYYGHTIGTAWGDLDNDGDFDSVQANLAHPRYWSFSDKTQVLLQDDGEYTDLNLDTWGPGGSASGLRYQETHSVPVLGDFDNDGVLDLSISAVYPGRPTDFYWGVGDGTFVGDWYHAGITIESGWGMAAADFDGDGDLDIAAQTSLFRNDLADRGDAGHWLSLRPVGNVSSNRAAIGATVRVTAGGNQWLRYVPGGTGQGGQDSLFVHVGLGGTTSVDTIEVDFPGGGTITYDGPFDADQRLWLMEDGGVEAGWAPPAR